MTRPIVLAVAAVLLAGCTRTPDMPGGMRGVTTTDVHDFVAAYGRLEPGDTLCAALERYFEEGTRGLRAYRLKFSVGRPALCKAVLADPATYGAVLSELPEIDSAAARIRDIFETFKAMYLEGRPPRVYLLVGNGVSGGTTTTGKDPYVLVAIEKNHTLASIRATVAHEFVHTQQHYPWFGSMTGGPKLLKFLRATLLRQAITEGSADLIAELVTGVPKRNAYGEAHEAELWQEFRAQMHSKDYGGWLYDGRAAGDTLRPPDLGYFIGYRIAKAYYDKMPDKSQAIHDILHIQDFDRFVVESGYTGAATR